MKADFLLTMRHDQRPFSVLFVLFFPLNGHSQKSRVAFYNILPPICCWIAYCPLKTNMQSSFDTPAYNRSMVIRPEQRFGSMSAL